MPKVVWSSTVKAKDCRSADLTALLLKVAQVYRDSGAASARVLNSNAGPTAPSIVVLVEYTGMGQMEEVDAKVMANKWIQEALSDPNIPGTAISQALAQEVE